MFFCGGVISLIDLVLVGGFVVGVLTMLIIDCFVGVFGWLIIWLFGVVCLILV